MKNCSPLFSRSSPSNVFIVLFLYFIKNLTQVSFFIKVEHDGAKEVIVRKNPFVDVVNHSVETRTLWFWCRITRRVWFIYVFQNYTWHKNRKTLFARNVCFTHCCSWTWMCWIIIHRKTGPMFNKSLEQLNSSC